MNQLRNIKLAIRNLFKNSGFTIVNLVGLSTGFAISVVLLIHVHYHYSFDKQVPDNNNTYRIISRIQNGNYRASTFGAFAEPLKKNTKIESVTTFYCHHQEQEYTTEGQTIGVETNIYADADFIDFFNIKVITGKSEGLNQSNSVLLSEQTAARMFGNENPLGKVLLISKGHPGNPEKVGYSVCGVFKDLDKNSHLTCDIVLSKKGEFENPIQHINSSKTFGAYIYVKSKENLVGSTLEANLSELAAPVLKGKHGPPLSAFQHTFQPLKQIHFSSNVGLDFKPHISKPHINILFIIGMLVLLTAIFNFLVMNTGLSGFRWKQSQVLRYFGGSRNPILSASFWETTILVALASGIAVVIVIISDSGIKRLLSADWSLSQNSMMFLLLLLVLSVVIVLLSLLTSMPLFKRLKLNSSDEMRHVHLGKIKPLVIAQFVIVIALVGFNIIIKKQLHYINDKELGFDADNVAVFEIPGRRSDKLNVLKERVLTIPGVQSTGVATHFPGRRYQDMNFETTTENFPFQFAMVDEDAIHTLGIQTKEVFNEAGENKIFINETFYNSLAKSYTKQQIVDGSMPQKNEQDPSKMEFKINGVLADFHYNSLYSQIGNFAFFVGDARRLPNRCLLARINQKNSSEIVTEITKVIENVYPGLVAEPTYLNKQLNQQYQTEKKLLESTNFFSWITIVITCFGLFAFSLTFIQNKTKEIGIRKVNGAKVSEILTMLNKDFIKWVTIAFIMACPVAYYAMNKWLENFAYRTSLSWWVFASAGVLAIGIALLTVSWQSWRAATRNPVEALRYE